MIGMLRPRVITGVIAAALVLWIVVAGGLAFVALVGIAVLLIAVELQGLMRLGRIPASLPVMVAGSLGFVVLESLNVHSGSIDYAIVLFLVLLAGHLLGGKMDGALVHPAAVFAGSLYAGMPLSQFIRIRNAVPDSVGLGIVMMVLVSVWACDIAAYFVGSTWGRHKLCPVVSPAKSVEGAVAGLISAVLLPLAVNFVSARFGLWYVFDPLRLAAFGLVIGLVAQIGDLIESMFKRSVNAKDSGNILPGHGGLLDRCDSLIAASAVAHLAAVVFLV